MVQLPFGEGGSRECTYQTIVQNSLGGEVFRGRKVYDGMPVPFFHIYQYPVANIQKGEGGKGEAFHPKLISPAKQLTHLHGCAVFTVSTEARSLFVSFV